MKITKVFAVAIILIAAVPTFAQLRRKPSVRFTKRPAAVAPSRGREAGARAVVMDETLSVLRDKPSLFAQPLQRMRRGRKVTILGVTEADGVKFFKVAALPTGSGWVQADSVFGTFRPEDESRLANLAMSSGGFDQLELAQGFLDMYPASQFRPQVLLLYGDIVEDAAVKLSKDANSRLKRGEMAAAAAPLHSYFLNYVGLDRYRKLGVIFLFNSSSRAFHYDGTSWNELARKYPESPQALEAKKRLDNLVVKMEKVAAK